MTILKENIPVGLASDHAGYELKEYVKQLLTEKSIPFHPALWMSGSIGHTQGCRRTANGRNG